MQPSETRRLSFFRSSSTSANGSVLRSQDVTKDSNRVPTLMAVNSRIMKQNVQTYQRPSTTMTSTQLSHWNSQPRRLSLQHHRNANMSRDREGVNDLALFLMTHEPPPNNWVSNRSDDDKSAHSINISAIKIFTRRKKTKKKSTSQKLLQLPDSAVSAKTSSGVRHIAISIPIEYDHFEKGRIENKLPSIQRIQPQRVISEKGTVTVLKPVIEVRESRSISPPVRGRNEVDSGILPSGSRPGSRQTPPPAKRFGLEATQTVEMDYSEFGQQPNRIKPPESTRPAPRTHVPVNTINPDRTNSMRTVRSDPRHSGGSAYSNATITSQNWLSRGPSNASMSSPPTRSSSKFNFAKTLGPADFIQIGGLDALCDISTPEDQPQLRTPTNSTFDKDISSERGSPTIFGTGTAKIIRSYSVHGLSGGPRLISGMTPIAPAGPAPTRMLPELPNHEPRPSSAPLLHARSISTQALKSIAEKQRGGGSFPMSPREARREHVRAKKQKDIEKLRSQRSSASLRIPISPPPTSAVPVIQGNEIAEDPIPMPSPDPRRPQPFGSERSSMSKANTMTSIMIVADLEPISEEQMPRIGKKSSSASDRTVKPNNNSHDIPHQTSGESLSGDEGDSDTLPGGRRGSIRTLPTHSAHSSIGGSISGADLQNRRQERRSRRNTNAREKDVDLLARLERVEKENRALMEVVNGIAKGFGELSALGLGRRGEIIVGGS